MTVDLEFFFSLAELSLTLAVVLAGGGYSPMPLLFRGLQTHVRLMLCGEVGGEAAAGSLLFEVISVAGIR